MENKPHYILQLERRGISVKPDILDKLALNCNQDTAIVLKEFRHQQSEFGGSNGELLIIIVRNKKVSTVMFRRKTQPLTKNALRVAHVADLR